MVNRSTVLTLRIPTSTNPPDVIKSPDARVRT
jgi:hypothetical protein